MTTKEISEQEDATYHQRTTSFSHIVHRSLSFSSLYATPTRSIAFQLHQFFLLILFPLLFFLLILYNCTATCRFLRVHPSQKPTIIHRRNHESSLIFEIWQARAPLAAALLVEEPERSCCLASEWWLIP